ncbi:hypothetical protein diail_1073 [Diaporthe ilicicola]|nr:hypothetical protein diail_1073 [Diaporthe ilicicola]
MCRPAKVALDKHARDTGLCPQAVWPLDRVIRHGGPGVLERVQLVLGRGGIRMNTHWPNCGSLVFVAITADSPVAVDFLLSRGVSVHGEGDSTKVVKSRGWTCHVPVLAAAHTMARSDHGVTMMRLVLQHGVDINHCIKVFDSLHSYSQNWGHYCTTPLLVFLDSVPSRKEGPGPDPVEGTKLLFDSGAPFRLPDNEEPGGISRMSKYTGPSWPVDLLLGRWGLKTLNEPQFLAVLKSLVRYGGFSPEEVAEMIAHRAEIHSPAESPAIVEGRGLLLDVLMDGRTAPESNKVLDWLLIKTGRTVDLLRVRYGQALDRLLAARALADSTRVTDGSLVSDDGVRLVIREGSAERHEFCECDVYE